MTKEETLAAVKKHGGIRAAAKALRINYSTFRKRLVKLNGGEAHAVTPVSSLSGKGKTLADFKATYDKSFIVPNKIRAALKELGNGWAYELDLCRLAGVSVMDIGRVRDQFAEHVVVLNRESKRAWAGTKATAKAMRNML